MVETSETFQSKIEKAEADVLLLSGLPLDAF